MLSQSDLHELIDYNAETGEARWRVSRGSTKAGKLIACTDSSGYVMVRIDGVLYRLHRIVWVYQYGRNPNGVIDHINGIKSDNRLANLRECPQRFNAYNSKRPTHNTTGYKGVSFCRKRKKFRANLYEKQKQVFLGYFDTAEQANIAYTARAKIVAGDFCRATQ